MPDNEVSLFLCVCYGIKINSHRHFVFPMNGWKFSINYKNGKGKQFNRTELIRMKKRRKHRSKPWICYFIYLQIWTSFLWNCYTLAREMQILLGKWQCDSWTWWRWGGGVSMHKLWRCWFIDMHNLSRIWNSTSLPWPQVWNSAD